MRAFVAGATGLTGRHVVEALTTAGVETTAHIRPDSSSIDRWRAHFGASGAVTDTSAWTSEAMTTAMVNLKPDLVFGLLGTTRKRTRAGDGNYMAVDYGLTALLVDAVASGPRSRFVYLSSVGAHADARGDYMRARWLAEEHIRSSGLPHMIARPSFILGERDEPRPGESVGAGFIDGALGLVGALGGSRWTAPYRSILAPTLAENLVRLSLEWDGDDRIVYTPDLAD